MKSIIIKCTIGWALSNFVLHMSSIYHHPMNVWDLMLIALVTCGGIAMVVSICNFYNICKQYKESEAKYREAMKKWEALVKKYKV